MWTIVRHCVFIFYTGPFASLVISTLFANVPVGDIIDIIISYADNNDEVAASPIPKDTMRKLLPTCKTEILFSLPFVSRRSI